MHSGAQFYVIGDLQNGIKYILAIHKVQHRFWLAKASTQDPKKVMARFLRNTVVHIGQWSVKVSQKESVKALEQCFSTFFAWRHLWSAVTIFGGTPKTIFVWYNEVWVSLGQWFPTNTRVPWAGARGAANSSNSLIFIPIKPARGATKYLQY